MKKPTAVDAKITVTYLRKPPALIRWDTMTYASVPLQVGISEEGFICYLGFVKSGKSAAPAWKKNGVASKFVHDPQAVAPVIKKIKTGKPLQLLMAGSEFQRAVWRGLLNIPRGTTLSYGELAGKIKRPRAVRAVGTACGANPIAVLVPCHRVLAGNGGLGGFGGGLPAKKKLLESEGFQQFRE